MKKKLGILLTHPIQYYSPLFRCLSKVPDLETIVFYCHQPSPTERGVGFGVPFDWDVDLLSGYRYRFLNNISAHPNLLSFGGCDTPEIRTIIEKEKFNFFMVTGWATKSMWQAMRACWRSQTPLVARGDSTLNSERGFLKKIAKRLLYPFFMSRFHACMTVGKRSREYFSFYGAKKIINSPHFVDNEFFGKISSEAKTNQESLKKKWAINPSDFVFLFVGKFEAKKRPMDILKALKNIVEGSKTHRRLHLLMVGDGLLKKQCEAFTVEHRLPVSFTGFMNQSEIAKAYAVSDCLILPSDGRETWGLVVNEAMACGVPAIVSDQVGCAPDLVKEGKTGLIFKCGDVLGLSGAMVKMANVSDLSIFRGALKNLIKDYSVEKACRVITDEVLVYNFS